MVSVFYNTGVIIVFPEMILIRPLLWARGRSFLRRKEVTNPLTALGTQDSKERWPLFMDFLGLELSMGILKRTPERRRQARN